MRFEQPVDNVVARFPELRVAGRERTVAYVSHEEIQAAVALGRRLQARQVREAARATVVRPLAAVARAMARWVSHRVREYKRNRDRRITIRELRALEDHQLRDIGLERGDIVSVATRLADEKHGAVAIASEGREPVRVEETFEPLRAA